MKILRSTNNLTKGGTVFRQGDDREDRASELTPSSPFRMS